MTHSSQFTEFPITRVGAHFAELSIDAVAIEEPLEIRLLESGQQKGRSISITMRTPGQDMELAAGFLFTEGIIKHRGELESIRPCGPKIKSHGGYNIARAKLKPGTSVSPHLLDRNFYVTSSCGICGKASLDALERIQCTAFKENEPLWTDSLIHGLASKARSAQRVFDRTGGLHAAALFNEFGALVDIHEDVGRHNAVDKIIGRQFLTGRLPAARHLLFVSGRASFELTQKALIAGISTLIAVGAPSSLAVDLAVRFQMTLLGFVRQDRYNIYSGKWRIANGKYKT